MSLPSDKKFSLDEMTAMHEIEPLDEMPTVEITEEEWTALLNTINEMQSLAREITGNRRAMQAERVEYFQEMRKTANSLRTTLEKEVKQMTYTAKDTIEQTARQQETQVGKLNETLSSMIVRQERRERILWGVRLLFSVLPGVLVLLSALLSD